MKTTHINLEPLQRFVLPGVSWQEYNALIDALGNRRLRHAYGQGTLEIISPSFAHEQYKSFLGRLVESVTEELESEIKCVGSMTMRPDPLAKGIEPDACYFIQNELAMRGKDEWDPISDPPPDLAIEIDVSSSSVQRKPIYAALRVPELWRFDGERLNFETLGPDQTYQQTFQSFSFPFLKPSDLLAYLEQLSDRGENALLREFRKAIRQTIQ